MNEDLSFIGRYRSKGALFDANLLLVYVVGKCCQGRLPTFHHTKQYAGEFDTIGRLFEYFGTVYTTPNVLTEVSNLGKKLGVDFFDQLESIVQVLDEQFCTSKDAVSSVRFRDLGLTDSALLTIGPRFLIVTADAKLYLALRASNIDAVNYNHIRFYWS